MTTNRQPGRSRRGFTLTEIIIASAISVLVAGSVMSLSTMTSRFGKGIFWQQRSLMDSKQVVEFINSEIRQATTPLTVIAPDGNPGVRGNRVVYNRNGEAPGLRALEIISVDGDFNTPEDNTLIFDPNTSVAGDEFVIATMNSPIDPDGVFRYVDATTPLEIDMRIGDPLDPDLLQESNRITGYGLQGMEINITVAPRN